MANVIPAINASDLEIAKKQILIAKNFLPANGWIHIDVVDGRFSPNVTWGNPAEFADFLSKNLALRKINFEIHLMMISPETATEDWLKAEARRLIVHEEAAVDAEAILKKCLGYGAELMVAIKPETPVEKLKPFFNHIQYFQILAVKPGWAGQKFQPEILEKIKSLRAELPSVTIEVDGGMTPETVKVCREAGADLFVSAS